MQDVKVFKISEVDAVAAHTLEGAREWYKRVTGFSDDELYSDEEVEVVSHDYKILNIENVKELITVREVLEEHWFGEPFIVFTTEL